MSNKETEELKQWGCGLLIVGFLSLFVLFICLGILPWLWHIYATYWQWVCR